MAQLSRIGLSLDSDLLDRFDKFIADKGYDNRSEAFRDLIRDQLVGTAVVASKAPVVGTVTLIYDHHTRLLPEKLADLQHQHHEVVISALHAHLDHHTCLEGGAAARLVPQRSTTCGQAHKHKGSSTPPPSDEFA